MWKRLRAWVKDSETIALARLQVLAGIIITVLATFDPSVLAPLIGEKDLFDPYFPQQYLAD